MTKKKHRNTWINKQFSANNNNSNFKKKALHSLQCNLEFTFSHLCWWHEVPHRAAIVYACTHTLVVKPQETNCNGYEPKQPPLTSLSVGCYVAASCTITNVTLSFFSPCVAVTRSACTKCKMRNTKMSQTHSKHIWNESSARSRGHVRSVLCFLIIIE